MAGLHVLAPVLRNMLNETVQSSNAPDRNELRSFILPVIQSVLVVRS